MVLIAVKLKQWVGPNCELPPELQEGPGRPDYLFSLNLPLLSSHGIIGEKLLLGKKLAGSGINVRGVEFKVLGVSKDMKCLGPGTGKGTTAGGVWWPSPSGWSSFP